MQTSPGDQSRIRGGVSVTLTLQQRANINLSRVIWKISVVVARAGAQASKAGRPG